MLNVASIWQCLMEIQFLAVLNRKNVMESESSFWDKKISMCKRVIQETTHNKNDNEIYKII